MKYILIGLMLLNLSACYTECNLSFRDYKYLDKVTVHSGFYKGQSGIILGQTWLYNADSCNTPGFRVKLDSTLEEIQISQYALEVN